MDSVARRAGGEALGDVGADTGPGRVPGTASDDDDGPADGGPDTDTAEDAEGADDVDVERTHDGTEPAVVAAPAPTPLPAMLCGRAPTELRRGRIATAGASAATAASGEPGGGPARGGVVGAAPARVEEAEAVPGFAAARAAGGDGVRSSSCRMRCCRLRAQSSDGRVPPPPILALVLELRDRLDLGVRGKGDRND